MAVIDAKKSPEDEESEAYICVPFGHFDDDETIMIKVSVDGYNEDRFFITPTGALDLASELIRQAAKHL